MKRLLLVLLGALPLVAPAQRKPAASRAALRATAPRTAASAPRVAPATPGTVAPLPVPAELQFAGLRLRLSDGGRAAVQQKVDALRRHPGSFYARVATADAAFPIIERVLQEEGVPLDFRFLCIQESGLQGDAQSIHDAVGYWQFKREAAADFGLEVSDNVDERKHLVAATHGAAKYLLRSQRMYQNWLHTLLSYNLGPGGVKPYTLPTDAGATEMQITEQTHPYVLTFLAHKLAYESAIGTNPRPAMRLREYPAIAGQSLASLAQAIQTDPAELSKHNRWLLAAAVPPGRSYTALVPVTDSLQLLAMSVQQRQVATKLVTAPETDPHNAAFVTVNGLRAVVALPGESKEDLARRAGVKLRKFMQFNDLMPFDAVVVGQPYFTQKKRDKATVEYHVTQAGESLATVSQKYGVRARAIRSKNRMAANENLQPGRVLWLQHTRPRAVAVEYVQDKTGAVAAAMERPTGQPAPAAPAPVAPAPTPAAPAPPKRKPAEAEVSTSRPAAPQRGVVDDAPEASEDSTRTGGLLGKLQQPAAETADEAPADSAAAADETVANLNEAAEATPVPPANPAPAPAKANRDLYAGQADNKQLPASSPLADEPSGADGDEEPVPAVTRPVAAAPNPAPATKPAPAAATPAPTASAAVPAAPKSVTTAATPTAPKPAATVSAAPKPAPSAAPRPTPAAPAAPGPALEPGAGWPVPANGLHTVQAKETLYGVARRYNLRPADLIQWNNLPPNPALQLGQVLRVTPPAAGTAAPATAAAPSASTPKPSAPAPAKPAPAPVAAAGGVKHTVVSGDTMYSISRKYGVTPKQIMDWNGKADSNVRLGEVLTVQPAAQ